MDGKKWFPTPILRGVNASGFHLSQANIDYMRLFRFLQRIDPPVPIYLHACSRVIFSCFNTKYAYKISMPEDRKLKS